MEIVDQNVHEDERYEDFHGGWFEGCLIRDV